MSDVGHPAETKAQQLIATCMDAYTACRLAAAYAVNEGGDVADPHRMQALHDAADLSLTLANLLTRASHLHRRLAALTGDAAEAAAEALQDLEDEPLQRACEACAELQQACADLPKPA